MNSQQLEEARRLHQYNVKRARVAALRQKERDQANYEARMQRERDQRACEQSQLDAQQAAAQSRATESQRKRPIQSTQTASQSRTISAGGKRSKLDHPQPLLVWNEESAFGPHTREALVERALREGCPEPKEADEAMIRSAIRDGLAIRADSDGAHFYTNGLDSDAWTKASKWKELVSGLQLVEDKDHRTRIVADGGKSCTKIGQGTFNIVLSYPPMYVSSELPSNLAWRVTRPDKDEAGDHRYQSMNTTVGELKNALFASSNRIGVSVYGVAAFEAMRPGRTMRHGIVMAMQRAECDLIRSLDGMRTEAEGSEAAEKMIDLLFSVSRMGIAFTDIKPGNVLAFKDKDGSVFYRLTDYDPAFFIVTDKDWRSLLLLNLAFLSAHVHNTDFGAAGRGWAKTVAPVLRQLIRHRSKYESEWLFAARSVAIDFREPRSLSDFELQRNVTSMWYSYFVKRCGSGSRASRFKWGRLKDNKRDLDEHWKEPCRRDSWPRNWTEAPETDDTPLVKQMVDFALEYC
tara:strand:+ start:8315 stop:9868 length:1554 start_codon:yes stop_codon:yes gene_type:complete